MKRQLLCWSTLLFFAALFGCGGGSTSSTASQGDFSVEVAPSTVNVVPGGPAQVLSVATSSMNGFNGTVAVAIGKLPAGVTASPTTLSLTPTSSLGQITITASSSAVAGTASVALTGTSGSLSHNATASLQVGAAPAGDFSLAVAPSMITVVPGGVAQVLSVAASPTNGFDGTVAVTIGSLPAGVTASPTTLSLTPTNSLGQITITASSSAVAGSASVALTGTSGSLSHNATASLQVGTAPPLPVGDFSLAVAPSMITVAPGGAAQVLSVAASPTNGFDGTVAVAVGSLPAGVTASPMILSLTPTSPLGQITLTASNSAVPGTASVAFTGTSGSLSHNATAALQVTPPQPTQTTTASLSETAFNFGNNLVNNTLTEAVVTVTNTGLGVLTLNPTVSGDPSYSIASGTSCTSQLAIGANCNVVLSYTPTTASSPAAQNAVLNLGFGNVPAGTPQTVAIAGISAALPAGQVGATDNPQVALYTMTLPFPGSITVSFGPDTNYGLNTWAQSTATAGGQVSIFVAGMLASTTYHMRASVTFSNGITANDTDHTFTTKAVPPSMRIGLQTATTSGMTPQPGLELLNALQGNQTGVAITDLAGNILWAYSNPGSTANNFIDGVKMLPDGDLLMAIGPNSSVPLTATISAAAVNEIREVNLAGDTVREITISDLNTELAAAGCAECNVTLATFHHDVTPLPNGHWLLLANTLMALSPSTNPPLTNSAPTTVLGDVIVDLDENMQPVWVWNEFKHLDPNRHPLSFPDWTHTNAVVYSPDDGNILVSLRHQNWVLKVNYADGTGDGSILWHLGEGGDFTLVGGTDPTDWAYAQHAPSFFSSNTAGVFSLGLMDNGNDRLFPSGVTCGTSGAPPCTYSTVPVWQIDETAKTATLIFHQILPPTLYNGFGGNAELLENGDVEYDLCGTANYSYVYEVTDTSDPQTVWTLHTTTTDLYRAFRIPSFYPGVQW